MKPYPHCQVLCLWVNGLDQTSPIRHVCCSECHYRGNCHLWASHTAVGHMLERYGFKRWWWGLFDEVSSTIAFLQVTPQPCAVTQRRSLLATTCCNYHFSSPFLLHNPKSEFGPFPFHIWETLCFAFILCIEVPRESTDTVPMAQLRSTLCHCLSTEKSDRAQAALCRPKGVGSGMGADRWCSLCECPDGRELCAA